MDLTVTLAAAAGIAVVMIPTWLLSLVLRDASVADVAWGLVFIVIVWAAYAAGAGTEAMLVAAGVVTVWGIRLSAYIGIRNRGHGEDRRYAAMRERRPERFWIWSLFGVFLLQGAIALVVSLPLQSLASDAGAAASFWTWAGLAVALVGYGFEAVGDAQLAAFKGEPANGDRVMDRGLWRYTRHPNYFGDAVFWWGVWVIAVGSGAALWTLVGPALMTFLLVRVSGVRLLESDIAGRRPEYVAYIRRTSAFIPRPPRAG